MPTIAERVANGIRWLDQHHSGWLDFVTIADLDLRVPSHCILGQCTDVGYYRTIDEIQSGPHDWKLLHQVGEYEEYADGWAADHGFRITDDEYSDSMLHSYRDLTQAWKDAIVRLRGA